jgi:hypothetical protein
MMRCVYVRHHEGEHKSLKVWWGWGGGGSCSVLSVLWDYSSTVKLLESQKIEETRRIGQVVCVVSKGWQNYVRRFLVGLSVHC